MENVKLLILRLTERCNLKCAYCYAAREGTKPFDMDEATALRAVELCCMPGSSLRIQFTGGEPLLKLELMEAVAAFGKSSGRRLILSVQTNGTLLTPDVCRRLKAIRCGVGVSLDGIEEDNKLRVFPDGTPSYGSVVEGIRNLGQAGMCCGLTAVVTAANAAHLGTLPDLALYLGNVAGVGLDLFRPLGRGAGQDLAPTPEDFKIGLRDLKAKTETFRNAGISFKLRELDRLHKRKALSICGEAYCYAQTSLSLAVDGRGNIWPCSSLAGLDTFLLGNIRDSLPQKNDKADLLAAPKGCRSCDSFALCLGGCPAARTGSRKTDQLACLMHHVLSGKEMEEL